MKIHVVNSGPYPHLFSWASDESPTRHSSVAPRLFFNLKRKGNHLCDCVFFPITGLSPTTAPPPPEPPHFFFRPHCGIHRFRSNFTSFFHLWLLFTTHCNSKNQLARYAFSFNTRHQEFVFWWNHFNICMHIQRTNLIKQHTHCIQDLSAH